MADLQIKRIEEQDQVLSTVIVQRNFLEFVLKYRNSFKVWSRSWNFGRMKYIYGTKVKRHKIN